MNKTDYLKKTKGINARINELESEKRIIDKEYIEANKVMCVGKKYRIVFEEDFEKKPIAGQVYDIKVLNHKKTPSLVYHMIRFEDDEIGNQPFHLLEGELLFSQEITEIK